MACILKKFFFFQISLRLPFSLFSSCALTRLKIFIIFRALKEKLFPFFKHHHERLHFLALIEKKNVMRYGKRLKLLFKSTHRLDGVKKGKI